MQSKVNARFSVFNNRTALNVAFDLKAADIFFFHDVFERFLTDNGVSANPKSGAKARHALMENVLHVSRCRREPLDARRSPAERRVGCLRNGNTLVARLLLYIYEP